MPDICPNCGTPLAADAIFCHRCGRNFTVEMAAREEPPAAASGGADGPHTPDSPHGPDGPEGPEGPDAAKTIERLRRALGDRYAIERELGRGGMATVFLAQDLKHGREVAIKVLHPDLSASVGAERFEREIRLAAKLQHPNILALYDSGSADGLLYYVMPFVKGESLRDRLDREHMLPIDDAVAITLQVSDALGYAHEQGIVHRDIKPENILLTGGHALVADFGIARAVSEGGERKLTQTGMSMGTPYYMAPEQASGDVVGPSSDIYSLGCMLYEMLAGEPPFTGKNSMQIMARHAMEQVPSIRIVRNTVPEEVEDAILASLAKVPADRPQNAAQFSELLGLAPGSTATMRALRMTPTGTRRLPSGAQPWRRAAPVPLWRRPLTLAIAAIVVLAAGGGIWRWRAAAAAAAAQRLVNASPDAHRIAVLYFEDLSKNHSLRPLADGLTEGLIHSLEGAQSFTVISTNGVAQFRGSSVGPDSIARALHAGYLVRGSIERDGDSLRVAVRLDDASGVDLKRGSFSRPATNVLAIRDTLSVVVANFIRQQLGQQLHLQQQRIEASNSDAWLLLQRGQEAQRAMEAAAAAGDTAGTDSTYHRADSLYAAAATLDSKWPDPVTDRGQLAYRRSRLARDPVAVRKWVTLGLAHADAALKIDPNDADALQLRGTLEYFGWLSNLETDPAKKKALLTAARNDLLQSTTINHNQAGAYAVLSSLDYHYPTTTNSDVLIDAQRAYEADEFQTGVNLVLLRIFNALYDLGQFDTAQHWCTTFNRRFPTDHFAVECRLLMLTANDASYPPNVPRAWRIADSLTAVAPASQREKWHLVGRVMAGWVIARASKTDPALADSARHVIESAQGNPSVDPTRDLPYYGAMAYAAMGDDSAAVRLLKIHLAVNPQEIPGLRQDPGWQLRPLQNDPAFKRLVGAGN